jgi:MFS-type transporter involved in bile tolerance (Atg22 family)
MRWVIPSAWLLGIGWYFVVCVVGGVLIGRWLDDRFDTGKTFALIGIFAGLAMALFGGYRMLTERLLKRGSGSRGGRGGP